MLRLRLLLNSNSLLSGARCASSHRSKCLMLGSDDRLPRCHNPTLLLPSLGPRSRKRLLRCRDEVQQALCRQCRQSGRSMEGWAVGAAPGHRGGPRPWLAAAAGAGYLGSLMLGWYQYREQQYGGQIWESTSQGSERKLQGAVRYAERNALVPVQRAG